MNLVRTGICCRHFPACGLVALVVVFFVFYVFVGSLSFGFPDFQDHSKAAERIARGELLYRDHISYLGVYHYPPVFLYSLALVYYLVGVNLLAAKVFLAVFNLLSGILLYLLVRDYLGENVFFVVFLFFVNPLTVSAVYVGYFDNFVVFFMLFSVYFLLQGRPFLAGFLLAVSFMSKLFPVLVLFVLAPFYLRLGRAGFFLRFLLAFLLGVFVISVPFLVLTPREFIYYAFFYNFERSVDSLSLYFYFLPGLVSLSVVFQAVFLGWLSWRVYGSDPAGSGFSFLARWFLFLFLGFFVLNRINYPHYLIYVVPFFSFVLVEEYGLKKQFLGFFAWKQLALAFSLVLLGSWVWAYQWSQGVSDFRSSGYFWLGAVVYFLGCFYFLVVLYYRVFR